MFTEHATMVMSFILHVRQDVCLKIKKKSSTSKTLKILFINFFYLRHCMQYRIIGNFSESEIKRFNLNLGKDHLAIRNLSDY